jgi:hypothetical protein
MLNLHGWRVFQWWQPDSFPRPEGLHGSSGGGPYIFGTAVLYSIAGAAVWWLTAGDGCLQRQ